MTLPNNQSQSFPLPMVQFIAAVAVTLYLAQRMTDQPQDSFLPSESDPGNSPEELIEAVARDRDRGAFVKLFEQFGPRIKSYLIRQGADALAAEDLTQEVMLTLWRRANSFDPAKATVSTWIFTIARNRRIDVLRRSKRPEIDPNDPALVREPEAPADEVIDAAKRHKLLRAAMADLPAEQGDLLKQAYFEDKSHSLIAEQQSLPLGTVKSRLRLAVAKLRSAMEETS